MSAKRAILAFVGGPRGQSGVAAIEFAIMGAVLALVLVCTIDLGLGLYQKMEVQTAAQVGAQYAAEHGFDANTISTIVQNSASGLTVSASPAPSQSCGCPGASGVVPATCGSACADGNAAGVYVTVSSAGTYTTILPYPILPNTFSLASQSTVRIQ
jgi:Flp pilus assembly protein TadG